MPAGVVLDTSFLISLADSTRPNYQFARRYWQHFTENGIPMYLSTIVVSEFYIKQEIPEDLLRSCVVLPFNWEDATTSASLSLPDKTERGTAGRGALKDDLKIIAQAIVKDAAWVITDDSASFYKYADRLRKSGKAKFRPLKLEDGFDVAFLSSSGQHEMFDPKKDEEIGTDQ